MHRFPIAAALFVLSSCSAEPEKGSDMTAEEVADELSGMKIQPGQWEATNEILSATAPGMPPGYAEADGRPEDDRPELHHPEQAAKPSANFLAAQENSNCTYQDWSMRGGRMTGTMTCQGGEMPGKMVMTMDGKYGSTSYDMKWTWRRPACPTI